MFRVFCGADVIYDPRDPDLVLTGLKAELALNETGSFEFTMPVTHPYRGKIELMQKSREIVLEQDGEVLFRGRATQCQRGFYGDDQYRCEGDRAYLNDVTLPPYSTTNQGMSSTVDGLFNWHLSQYNSKVPPNQRFVTGINQGAELDPNNYIMRENSARVAVWPELKEKLLDKLGGYVRVRYENGLRYIDYLAGGDTAAAQRIEFGQNLLDYTRLQDATQFCTRIIPEGAEIDDADGNGTGVKLSIADLPDGPLQQGFEKVGDAIVNVEAERTHGVIEQVISFDDITVARNLLDRGLRHLVNVKVGDTMEITAVDLHMVDPTIESIRLGDYVRATSKPHGFDEYFICTRLTVYPDDPCANKFVLGSEYDTLTGRQSSKIAALNASINKQYDTVKQIDQTAKDAAQKATAASETANSASAEATDSSKKSDSAIAAAGNANDTAQRAENAANTANTTATEAKNTADTASSTANTAKDAAETAKATADIANSTATDAKNAATQTASDLSNFATNTNSALKDMQGQIDGSITTWFFAVPPTNDNVPANEWTTIDLRNNHLGDLYYDTNTGYSYRWQVLQSVYSWQRITDVDVTKALSDAAQAKDTADSKRRVFYSQPVPPYDKGDLWSQGTDGDMLICETPKTDGMSFLASDWGKASKYTDDTKAIEAEGLAAEAAKTATDYIDFGADGLIVGDMTDGTLSGNVRIASDGIELRDGTSVLARLKAGLLELAANSVNAIIKLCGGKGIIAYYAGTNQLAIMSPGSIAMTACQTLPDGTVQPYDAGIACNQYGVLAKGAVEISGTLRVNGDDVKIIKTVSLVSFGPYSGSAGNTYTHTVNISGFVKPPIAIPAGSGWCLVRSVSSISKSSMTFSLDCVVNTSLMSASFYLIEFL